MSELAFYALLTGCLLLGAAGWLVARREHDARVRAEHEAAFREHQLDAVLKKVVDWEWGP